MLAAKRRFKGRGKRKWTRWRTRIRPVRRAVKRTIGRKKALLRAAEVQPQEQGPLAETAGFDQGYNRGFDEGFNRGHDEGYHKGLYAGGDGIVDQLLPNGLILPEVSVQTIIASGIEALSAKLVPIEGTVQVMSAMLQAMDEKRPFSVVRLGDGELLTMAQENPLSIEQVKQAGEFLSYAGIEIPDLAAKALLLEAVRGADVVGIPLLRMPNYQHLAFSVFRANGIDYRTLHLTHSTINYAIYLEHWFFRMTAGRRVITVGNKADLLANVLRQHSIHVVDAITPVQGMKDVPRVMREIAQRSFDLALVSSGVPAVVIAYRIAAELGRAAIDFGHLADAMISGEAPLTS